MKSKYFLITLIIILLVPAATFAADESAAPGFVFMTIKMFSVLAVVIGIMLVCFNLLKKYMPQGNMLFSENKSMKIIETLYFGPKKSVVLIKVASEYILLGLSASEINYLKDIDFSDSEELKLREKKEYKNSLQKNNLKDFNTSSFLKRFFTSKK
jgi:flagellar biosynthetic protein FliO